MSRITAPATMLVAVLLAATAIVLPRALGADTPDPNPYPPPECVDCLAFSYCFGTFSLVDPTCCDTYVPSVPGCMPNPKHCPIDYPQCRLNLFYFCEPTTAFVDHSIGCFFDGAPILGVYTCTARPPSTQFPIHGRRLTCR